VVDPRARRWSGTRNRRVERLDDSETEGSACACSSTAPGASPACARLDDGGAEDAARKAVAFAKAAPGRPRPRARADRARPGRVPHAVERDPFSVPVAEKVELCLRAEEALQQNDVKVTSASVRAQREHKFFVSSEGASTEQELVECGGGIDALAARDGVTQIRSYPSAHGGSSAQAGWEYVEGLGLEREALRVGEQASALVRAEACPSGVTTVVIDAEQAALQVHESVGHPTELDRVYGTEAAYAGTSFLRPDDLGSLRYGSEHMNVTADSTTPTGSAPFGLRRRGRPAAPRAGRAQGVLSGFLTSPRDRCADRQRLGRLDARRQLEPHAAGAHDEPPPRAGRGLARRAGRRVDDGVFLQTNKSWSIDDKRLNFQFGTQIAWEIKGGELGRMLRDATYTGQTPVFWGSLDAVAGPEEWRLTG
jgi:TldD protein